MGSDALLRESVRAPCCRGVRRARAAGREVTFYTYPEVEHWFFEEDRPPYYDVEAARLAWERTVNFLRAQIGPT